MPPRPGTRLIDKVRPIARATGYPFFVFITFLFLSLPAFHFWIKEAEAREIWGDLISLASDNGVHHAAANDLVWARADQHGRNGTIAHVLPFLALIAAIVYHKPIKRYLHLTPPPQCPDSNSKSPSPTNKTA
jgi:hypothetical protein